MLTQTRIISGGFDHLIMHDVNAALAEIEQAGGVVKDIQLSSCGVPDGVWYSVLIVYVPAQEAS